MRTRLVTAALALAVLTGCGSGSTPSGTPKPGGGSVDCAAIKTAAQQLLAVQFLAQLRNPDTIESIRTGQIGGLDLDKFLAGMNDLHALDSFSSPLGDPKAAIEVYEKAGKAAQVLFATEPITQAAIDTYNENVGTVGEFLGHQVAISGAIDAAGC